MLQRLKPAVHKKWLIMISGLVWTGVGVLLVRIASKWFPSFNMVQKELSIGGGIFLGIIIAWFGFSNLAKKNAKRILAYPRKACIFGFQRWQSYILVLVMISMGIFLRTTPFVPRFLLAPMYIGIGLALFLSSFVYYKIYFRECA